MRDKEIVGLYQAYLDVYSNSNEEVEQLDESGLSQDTIRSAAKKRLRRVDADYREDTPEGDERGDKGMKKLDRTKRQLKINEPREVRMRANEEVENWVNSLIEEGYDLSEYTWDDMYDMYVTEGRYTSLSALSRESQKRKEDKERGRPETQAEIDGRLAMGDFSPGASQKERARGGRQRLRDRKKVPQKGGKDMFEHILEHLVAEGYADTNESALAIMANMSEEWRESIVEAAADQSNKQIEKGVKTTYKAGNVLDNDRSRGVNRVHYADRDDKVKRMRGRLKARRSDLFGERNKREDESRAEIKRKYGI
jgi:hypothetical protein